MAGNIIHVQENFSFVQFHSSVQILKPIRKKLGIHPSFGIASPRDSKLVGINPFEGSRLGRFADDERLQLLSHRATS